MPELPDISAYIDALRPRTVGRRLTGSRIRSVFLIRTFDPPIETLDGSKVLGVERLGKRVVLALEHDLFLVIHLMIAGRFLWKPLGAPARSKVDLGALDFEGPGPDGAPGGTLVLYEAGSKKRASVHVVRGRDALRAMHRGGLDILAADLPAFAHALRRENHTLKRSLTDPRLIDGVGNAYSDEILHAARLSPLKLTASLKDDETARLFDAARATLTHWIDALRREFGIDPAHARIGRFPGVGEVTAFRPDFAVHGRFGRPCPVCDTAVQRIVYADNETNYCPACQTDGRILADRSLSRLLKDDWPRSVEELEDPR